MQLLILLILIFFVFNIIMGLASLCTWVERKGSALIQDRVGANRAGAFVDANVLAMQMQQVLPAGVVLPIKWLVLKPVVPVIRALGVLGVINTLLCDAVKAILKEDFIPKGVSNFVHCLAPFMAVFPIFVSFAVIPLAPEFELFGYHIRPQVAPLDAGVLLILAMGSVSVYGVALAGWTGNNKFSLMGGLRAAAQMISYELALGLSIVSLIVVFGTLDLYEIVERQRGFWGVMVQPLGFVILFIAGMAETKRAPFDLPEAESELAAGYFTEYSGMKFLLFWLGEFAEVALFAILLTLFFFGGWHIPFVHFSATAPGPFSFLQDYWGLIVALIGHAVLMAKVVFFCVLQIVIRWTLPRFRYDQLMNLGWKILLPLSMLNLMATAAAKLIW